MDLTLAKDGIPTMEITSSHMTTDYGKDFVSTVVVLRLGGEEITIKALGDEALKIIDKRQSATDEAA